MNEPSENLTPRQIAGRLNQQKRRGLTPAGRQRLSDLARYSKPWQHSTGPRTASGKAKSAANGKVRQTKSMSVRERRAAFSDTQNLIHSMRKLRKQLLNRTVVSN